jgi:hypothetical protein
MQAAHPEGDTPLLLMLGNVVLLRHKVWMTLMMNQMASALPHVLEYCNVLQALQSEMTCSNAGVRFLCF